MSQFERAPKGMPFARSFTMRSYEIRFRRFLKRLCFNLSVLVPICICSATANGLGCKSALIVSALHASVSASRLWAKLYPHPVSSQLTLQVLVPHARFVAGNSIEETAARLDTYFYELIAIYPPKTKAILTALYTQRERIDTSPGQIEEDSQGNWHVDGDVFELASWKISVDPRIAKTKLVFLWVLIHEIAVHAGQFISRAEQVGVPKLLEELPQFRVITEISAALVERHMMNTIPVNQIVEDIRGNIDDPSIASLLIRAYQERYRIRRNAYLGLGHRPENFTKGRLVQSLLRVLSTRPEFAE